MVTRRKFLGLAGALAASCAGRLRAIDSSPDFQQQKGVNVCTWHRTGFWVMGHIIRHVSSFANLVSIVPTYYAKNISSEEIIRHYESSPSDASLRNIIRQIHAGGLEVQLKPHIDIIDANGSWRGNISPTNRFMKNYLDFIVDRAQFAENNGVEQFCIGTELDATVSEQGKWNRIIDSVANNYFGRLTYAANHNTEEFVAFWGHPRIDFIGSDFYYAAPGEVELGNITSQLIEPWKKLSSLSKQYGKKILITEFGLMPMKGANADPHNASLMHAYAPQELYLRIQSVLDLFQNKPWCAGYHAWAYWRLIESDPDVWHKNYNLYTKPAESLLIRRYRNG